MNYLLDLIGSIMPVIKFDRMPLLERLLFYVKFYRLLKSFLCTLYIFCLLDFQIFTYKCVFSCVQWPKSMLLLKKE